MKKFFTYLLILVWILPTSLLAQKSPAKFGKIDHNDFTAEICPIDSHAAAYVIFDYGYVDFDFSSNDGWTWELQRHLRIRILKNSAYDLADFQIPVYHTNDNKEKLYDLKAGTSLIESGKLVRYPMTKEMIFNEKKDNNIDITRFTLPKVSEGCIIEVSYRIRSEFFSYLRDWNFQWNVPVLKSEFWVKIPDYFRYNINMRGYEPLAVRERSTENATITVTQREMNYQSGFNPSQSQTSVQSINIRKNVQHLMAVNLPPLKPEAYVNSMDNYRSSLEFELESVNIPGVVRREYTTSWDAVVAKFLELPTFGYRLDKAGFAKSDVADIIEKYPDPEERMIAVYQLVKEKLKWSNKVGIYSDEPLRQVYNNGIGSAVDINFILINLLREADIKAYPVALSTRNNGVILPTFPTMDKFNYAVALVMIGDKKLLLDATDPYCSPGVLPSRCLNGQGRVIDRGYNQFINLEPIEKHYKSSYYDLSMDIKGDFTGKITTEYGGYASIDFRIEKDEFPNTEKLIENFESTRDGLEIEEFDLSGLDKAYGNVKMESKVTISEVSNAMADMISFNPLFFEAYTDNPFKLEMRNFPVDYTYPRNHKYILKLRLPEGYKVESLPENLMISLPDKTASFSYTVNSFDSVLNITMIYEINKPIFLPAEYTLLKEFYNLLVAKNKEMVIIRKI